MPSRSNILLILLLAVQLVLLAISLATSAGTEARPVEPILAGMSAADIDRLSFSDDLGAEVTVARLEGGWVLPGADDFPVNGDKVDDLLDKLARLDTRRLVATKSANFARLEVGAESFRRKVALLSGDASATLYLGGSGGADTVYVRRADEENVFLGLGLNAWELSTQISTWLDASYVSVSQDDILEIRVENAAGDFTFRRDGDSLTYADLEADEQFEDTKMPVILRNAGAIRLLTPLGLTALDEYGLAEPRVTVNVRYRELVEPETPPETTGDAAANDADEPTVNDSAAAEPVYREATYSLSFGADLEAGVALKSSEAEYYVVVRATVFEAFNDIKREDLIRQPETQAEAVAIADGGD